MKGKSCSFYHDNTSRQMTSMATSNSPILNNARSTMTPQAPSFVPKGRWHPIEETDREPAFTPKIQTKPPGNPEAESATPAQGQGDSRRAIPCVYYLHGSCRNGDNCSYAHSNGIEEDDDVQETSNLNEVRRFFSLGRI